jgi:thrombospondin type 3 repeat protein
VSSTDSLSKRLTIAAAAAVILTGCAGPLLIPAVASAAVDSDGDGLSDDFEIANHLDPQNPDSDRDYLNDGDEVDRYKTGPLNQDTDNDDISDGDEVLRYHTNPLVANPKPPAEQPPAPQPKDTDGDGLSDSDEVNVYRTDPNRKDTDRDGRDDGTEVKNGTNPRVPII